MTVRVPIFENKDSLFSYGEEQYSVSKLHWNARALYYAFDVEWSAGKLHGLPVTGGVDLLENYPQCPLPNLWAYNLRDASQDLLEEDLEYLALVIRED